MFVSAKCHLHICLRGEISARLGFLGGKNKKVMATFCTCEIMLCMCVCTWELCREPAQLRGLEVRKIKRYLESIFFELGFYFIGLEMFHE